MLVLSRRVGEKIMIGGGITVVVTRVSGNRVTLALEAPDDVRIVRGELKPLSDPFLAAPQPDHGDNGFSIPRATTAAQNAATIRAPQKCY
jgi:carbon storage regulator